MGRAQFPTGQQWNIERFDASGTFNVPADLVGGVIYASGCGAGSGGNSGGCAWSSGGGAAEDDFANGGAAGLSCQRVPIPVTAGESLTVTVGAAGTGGAAVVRTTAGSSDGLVGTVGGNVTIERGSTTIMALYGGQAPTWATGGRGLAVTSSAAAGITIGGDGGDDTVVGEYVGAQPGGADGTDDSTAKGGHGGGASGFGRGGQGGNGDLTNGANATGTAGADGINGSGGGGGGGVLANSATGFTATSGAGGNGGAGFVLFEWLESV